MRIADGQHREHTDVTRLTMRPLDRDALSRYVALDRPTDCAGSYKIEAAGVSLFAKIETDDFTAITGLPLIATVRMLEELGVQMP
jgi:septum formation protein